MELKGILARGAALAGLGRNEGASRGGRRLGGKRVPTKQKRKRGAEATQLKRKLGGWVCELGSSSMK
jgi:hypothetical protein